MDDHYEIERLILSYAYIVDDRSWERLNEIFTDDGAFIVEGPGVSREGLESIADFMINFPTHSLAHYSTNIIIDIAPSGDRATARTRHFGPHADGTFTIGTYHDTMVRTPRGWRIKRRHFIPRKFIRDFPQ